MRRLQRYHAHFLEGLPAFCAASFVALLLLTFVLLAAGRNPLRDAWSSLVLLTLLFTWLLGCVRFAARADWKSGWARLLVLYHIIVISGITLIFIILLCATYLLRPAKQTDGGLTSIDALTCVCLIALSLAGLLLFFVVPRAYRRITRRRHRFERDLRHRFAHSPVRSRGLRDAEVAPVKTLASSAAIAIVGMLFWLHPAFDGLGIRLRFVATVIILLFMLSARWWAEPDRQFGASADWDPPRSRLLAMIYQCGVTGALLLGIICLATASLYGQLIRGDLAIVRRETWTCTTAAILAAVALCGLLRHAYRRVAV